MTDAIAATTGQVKPAVSARTRRRKAAENRFRRLGLLAVILGGASFRGGTGRLRDTAIGVLFLAILNNGLSGLQMGDAQFFLIKGTIILAALTLRAVAQMHFSRSAAA